MRGGVTGRGAAIVTGTQMGLRRGSPWHWMGAPYELAARIRVWCYERGWFRTRTLPRPVISVGNLTVGGTGKTPVVIYLVERLMQQGRRVAVLSRGYRRRSRVPRLLVSDGNQVLVGPEEAGDEPHLIASRCPGVVVAVGADRHALGQWLLSRLSVDCFVLDDGFQHLALHRDVNLLLLDATDLDGLQALLPIGRLREPLTAAARASAILITRADREDQVEALWDYVRGANGGLSSPLRVTFPADGFRRVGSNESQPSSRFRARKAFLVSGIGNAGSFHRLVALQGLIVAGTWALADHAHYTQASVEAVRARAKACGAELVVTTEKDAGKVAPFLTEGEGWWALALRTEITSGRERLDQLLALPFPPPSKEGHA